MLDKINSRYSSHPRTEKLSLVGRGDRIAELLLIVILPQREPRSLRLMAVRSTHVHVSTLSDVLLIPLHRVCPEGPVVKAESALCYYYLPLVFLVWIIISNSSFINVKEVCTIHSSV